MIYSRAQLVSGSRTLIKPDTSKGLAFSSVKHCFSPFHFLLHKSLATLSDFTAAAQPRLSDCTVGVDPRKAEALFLQLLHQEVNSTRHLSPHMAPL